VRLLKEPSKTPREVVETLSNNHQILHEFKRLPWPFKTRRLLIETVWTKDDDEEGTFYYAWRPNTTREISKKSINFGTNNLKDVVLAETNGFILLKNNENRSCEVTYCHHVDLKGELAKYC